MSYIFPILILARVFDWHSSSNFHIVRICNLTINHHRASQSQITLLWHMYNTSYIYADTLTVNFSFFSSSSSYPEYQNQSWIVTTTARNLTSNDGNRMYSLKRKSLFIPFHFLLQNFYSNFRWFIHNVLFIFLVDI